MKMQWVAGLGMRVVFCSLCLTLTQPPLQAAEAVSEKMSCGTVRVDMDAEPPDRARIGEIFRVVERLMNELDRASAGKGGAMIYSRMSQDGKANASAMVTVDCGNEPAKSLEQAATDVYTGLYAMGKGLGVNP